MKTYAIIIDEDQRKIIHNALLEHIDTNDKHGIYDNEEAFTDKADKIPGFVFVDDGTCELEALVDMTKVESLNVHKSINDFTL